MFIFVLTALLCAILVAVLQPNKSSSTTNSFRVSGLFSNTATSGLFGEATTKTSVADTRSDFGNFGLKPQTTDMSFLPQTTSTSGATTSLFGQAPTKTSVDATTSNFPSFGFGTTSFPTFRFGEATTETLDHETVLEPNAKVDNNNTVLKVETMQQQTQEQMFKDMFAMEKTLQSPACDTKSMLQDKSEVKTLIKDTFKDICKEWTQIGNVGVRLKEVDNKNVKGTYWATFEVIQLHLDQLLKMSNEHKDFQNYIKREIEIIKKKLDALGQNKTSFGFSSIPAQTGLFGQQPQQPSGSSLFQSNSSNLFGSSAFGNQTTGTAIKFSPVIGSDTLFANTKHQCITCMKEYEGKSFEELRFEDYSCNRKRPQQQSGFPPFGTATSGSLFINNVFQQTPSSFSLNINQQQAAQFPPEPSNETKNISLVATDSFPDGLAPLPSNASNSTTNPKDWMDAFAFISNDQKSHKKKISKKVSTNDRDILVYYNELEELKTKNAILEQKYNSLKAKLSEVRRGCSCLETELSELYSHVNKLEEKKIHSSGRTKIVGLQTRTELALKKEIEEQQRLMQETITLVRDIRQTLFVASDKLQEYKSMLQGKKKVSGENYQKV